MASIHCLNVGPGDCTIIQHNSGRVSMIDICCGNDVRKKAGSRDVLAEAVKQITVQGNFRMCEEHTQPIDYLGALSVSSIFRFILTHPDMDHMDGLSDLKAAKAITVFWDSGVRKAKPDFDTETRYKEKDWDMYVRLREGECDTQALAKLSGARFAFANDKGANGEAHDGLYILAPNEKLRDDATESGDANDGSYVLLYRSSGGRIVLPGDAQNATWEHVLKEWEADVKNCAFLLAPHHGRRSDLDFSFLDTLRPTLTLIGCAPSEYIAYDAWRSRGLEYITSNQAGDVVLETRSGALDVFIQNKKFCEKAGGDTNRTNSQGYYFLKTIADGA